MPLVHGVGDEVLLAAVLAIPPVVYLWRSSLSVPLGALRSGAAAVKSAVCSLLGLGRRSAPPASEEGSSTSSAVQGVSMAPLRSFDMDGPPAGDMCSICHDDFTLPCQANCGHWFCGECIMQVWDHGSVTCPCVCPMCRREITFLIPGQGCSGAAASVDATGAPPQALRNVMAYNRRFGGGPLTLWQRVMDAPLLLSRMFREMRDPRRALSLLYNARILICVCQAGLIFSFKSTYADYSPADFIYLAALVCYVVSPLDVIPEAFFGVIGLLDDFVMILVTCMYLSLLYRRILLRSHS